MPRLKQKDTDVESSEDKTISISDVSLAEIREWAIKDFEKSGLTEGDFEEMKCVCMTSSMSAKLGIKPTNGYMIPYFDPMSQDKPLSSSISGEKYWRFRSMDWDLMYDETKEKGGPKIKAYREMGGSKYKGTPSEQSGIYFSPNMFWKTLEESEDVFTVFITEGEKKCMAMGKIGLFCIGVGGVNNYGDRANSELFTKNLRDFIPVLKNHEVHIAFDSDIHTNSLVVLAANKLRENFTNAGVQVVMRLIPPGFKALDDIIANDPVRARGIILNLPCYGREELECISNVNNNFVHVSTGSSGYFEIPKKGISGQIPSTMSRAEMIAKYAGQYAPTYDMVEVEKEVNDIRQVKGRKNIGEIFVDSPFQRRVHSAVFAPGRPPFYVAGDNDKLPSLNIWLNDFPEPVKNDKHFKLFKLLCRQLCGTESNWEMLSQYLIEWLAHTVRNPERKTCVGILLFGGTGTGKSTFAKIARKLHGRNGGTMGQNELEGSFNASVLRKTMIEAIEVTARTKKESDKIKSWIDSPLLAINQKNERVIDEENYTNFIFSTNEESGHRTSADDRRMLILRADRRDKGYRMSKDDWVELERLFMTTNEGLPALMYGLMNLKPKYFFAGTEPPMTEAKSEVIGSHKNPFTVWLEKFSSEPHKCAGYNDYCRNNSQKLGCNEWMFNISKLVDWFVRDQMTSNTGVKAPSAAIAARCLVEAKGWARMPSFVTRNIIEYDSKGNELKPLLGITKSKLKKDAEPKRIEQYYSIKDVDYWNTYERDIDSETGALKRDSVMLEDFKRELIKREIIRK
jgi:Domain of unknown function (DUF3854)/Family of unknown function (DUF5906)